MHPSDVAAIILEPVLGEGGFLTPPPGFMKALRQLADKHGIMLIADEVRGAGFRGMFGPYSLAIAWGLLGWSTPVTVRAS